MSDVLERDPLTEQIERATAELPIRIWRLTRQCAKNAVKPLLMSPRIDGNDAYAAALRAKRLHVIPAQQQLPAIRKHLKNAIALQQQGKGNVRHIVDLMALEMATKIRQRQRRNR